MTLKHMLALLSIFLVIYMTIDVYVTNIKVEIQENQINDLDYDQLNELNDLKQEYNGKLCLLILGVICTMGLSICL